MDFVTAYLLPAGCLLTFVLLYTLYAVYGERKVAAFIQDRYGPMETGKYGLLQSVADILKLIQKENINPAASDRFLFLLAPLIVFVAAFMGFAALPLAPGIIGSSANVGVFYVISILAVGAVGLLMAGWSSGNKYALLGAMRSVAQLVSYEIPAGVAIVAALMIGQTLNLQELSFQQGILTSGTVKFLGIWDVTETGGLLAWNIFRAPHLILAFLIYFTASLAECNRAPFDIPEAESELVAGFHVEYGGIRFAILFLAEYGLMLLVSVLAATLFLGGWNTPFPNIGALKLADWTTGNVWGIFWLIGKSFALVAVQIWIRWTLPRVRVDQLMSFSWKVLTPLAFLCLFISGLWQLIVLS